MELAAMLAQPYPTTEYVCRFKNSISYYCIMLKNLKIKNFRLLEDFKVSQLGRINLVVGKNNSGKSSVLEALRILAHKGRPQTLTKILASHDEYSNGNKRRQVIRPGERFSIYQFRDFFPGRQFPPSDEKKFTSVI